MIKGVHTVIQPGQWVRLKRGIYKGDLAQVIRTSDQQTRITVRFIPRLDFSNLRRDANDDQDSKKKDQDKKTKKDRFYRKIRPVARLFNAAEVKSEIARSRLPNYFATFLELTPRSLFSADRAVVRLSRRRTTKTRRPTSTCTPAKRSKTDS